MIQKLVNSAELADDLIPHPNAVRLQAINADVQFTGTENDEAIGKLLMEILNDKVTSGTLFKKEKLPGEWWPALTGSLESLLGEWGLDRVVRAIRVVDNRSINSRPLSEWACVTLAPDVSKVSGIESMKAALPAIEREWQLQYSGKTFLARSAFKTDDAARTRVLNAVIGDKTTPAADWGLILPYQKEYVQSLIKTMVSEFDTLSKNIVSEFDNLDTKLGRTLTRLDLADNNAVKELNDKQQVARTLSRDISELENKPQLLAEEKLVAEKSKEPSAEADVSILKDLEDSIKEIDKEFLQLRDDLLKFQSQIDEQQQAVEGAMYDFDEQKSAIDDLSRAAKTKEIEELKEALKSLRTASANVSAMKDKKAKELAVVTRRRDSALRYKEAERLLARIKEESDEITMHPRQAGGRHQEEEGRARGFGAVGAPGSGARKARGDKVSPLQRANQPEPESFYLPDLEKAPGVVQPR